jgi:hypothetical protein
MSFYTGTGVELLYCSNHAAATINFGGSAAEAQVNTAALFGVQAHIPADFWLPNPNQVGRGIRIVARGTINNVTTPTFTLTIRGGAAGNVASAPILLGTPTITIGGAGNTFAFYLCGDVILSAIGAAGANSTVLGRGTIQSLSYWTTSALTSGMFAGASATAPTATIDTSIVNYINVNAAFGAVSASNTVVLNQLLVFGLN